MDIHIMEYYPSLKRKKILPFVINLENITLGQISHNKKNKCYMVSLICGAQKFEQSRMVVVQGWGKCRDIGQWVQTFNCKTNKF